METGEVTSSVERIGYVDVQAVRDRIGAAKYVAKYLMKRWHALPGWMLESRRRFRKLRLSSRTYDVLERLYRHERRRGGRRGPVPGRRTPTRRLIERLARSGSVSELFRVTADGQREYVGTLPVPLDRWPELLAMGAEPVRMGRPGAWLFRVPGRLVQRLQGPERAAWQADVRRYERERREAWRASWGRHQRERAGVEDEATWTPLDETPPLHSVGGAPAVASTLCATPSTNPFTSDGYNSAGRVEGAEDGGRRLQGGG